jgi:hypothetical protein
MSAASFLGEPVAAAFLAAPWRTLVFATFLPAARDLRVEAAFFAAALRFAALCFRVAAAFRPAVLRMGLMFPPASSCGTALNLKFIRHASTFERREYGCGTIIRDGASYGAD